MVSKRKKKKWARLAAEDAAKEYARETGYVPNFGKNDRFFLEHLVLTTGNDLIRLQQASPDKFVNREAVMYIHAAVDELPSLVPDIADAWIEAFKIMGAVGVISYLVRSGHEELSAPFAEGVQEVATSPQPIDVPIEQVATLLDGPKNIYDPEFREEAPDIALQADRLLRRDGVTPSDSDLAGAAGVSEREPLHLSTTASGHYQKMTEEDQEFLVRLILQLAATRDIQATTQLSQLSGLELEVAGAFAKSMLSRHTDKFTDEQVKGLDRVVAAIGDELRSRPDS